MDAINQIQTNVKSWSSSLNLGNASVWLMSIKYRNTNRFELCVRFKIKVYILNACNYLQLIRAHQYHTFAVCPVKRIKIKTKKKLSHILSCNQAFDGQFKTSPHAISIISMPNQSFNSNG